VAGGATVGGNCATGGGCSTSGDSERGGEGSFNDGAIEVFDGGFSAAFPDLLEV
jgi:hypothetical protein